MTLEELRQKVRDWDNQQSDHSATAEAKYHFILHQLEHHGSGEWKIYLPSTRPDLNQSYMERLAGWIGNVSDEEDQKLLLEYALYVSFFSHNDFVALYRTAMDREVMRWVSSQISATLDSRSGISFTDVSNEIRHKTWFCPITDSLDINEFYKVNHLTGIKHRPGFMTLRMIAEEAGPPNPILAQNLAHYMNEQGLKRLVLLEDVVGSGNQCLKTLNWVLTNLQIPVLFIPLILCPNGEQTLRLEEAKWHGRFSVRPIIILNRSDLLGPERKGEVGWSITPKVEQFTEQNASLFPRLKAFGYEETGCSLATFANTPDNSLPIIHQKSNIRKWEPLFPRVFRD